MKKRHKNQRPDKIYIYEAPVLFAGLFYILLAVWTGICIILIGSKTVRAGWPLAQLLMIAFVLAYTWYFSLGIAYRASFDSQGDIELKSFRRIIKVNAKNIETVEGPRLAIVPFGFIRFRLQREKAYLFIVITDQDLSLLLAAIRKANPEMKFKGLPI